MSAPTFTELSQEAQDAIIWGASHGDTPPELSDAVREEIHAWATPPIEEGGPCPEPGCDGTLEFPRVEGCCCHINPPCSACTDNKLTCTECHWEEPEVEQPPPTQAERDHWAKYAVDWEAARQRGHTFENGGRIFDMRHDGSSGSTMVWTGQCEGPVTTKDIFEYLGEGTFGHRGPFIHGSPSGKRRFTYTLITD